MKIYLFIGLAILIFGIIIGIKIAYLFIKITMFVLLYLWPITIAAILITGFFVWCLYHFKKH